MDFSGNPAKLPQLAFTHGGRFHADDVFSAALLRIMRPDIRVYRGNQVPKNFSGIVFDIGDGPFDHHQKEQQRRKNGAAYAAFGLLWREYGHHFLPERAAQSFDDKFIQPLDIDDNKGTGNTLAGLIGAYNPTWDSDGDADAAFEEAVGVAQSLLAHKLESLAAMERGHAVVRAALEKMQEGIVVLEQYVPWKPVLVPSEAEFVVFPSERGGYSLQCVPRDFNGKTGHKVNLPREWHACPAPELQQLSGVPDVTFCHASGFMCSVGSVEGAKNLARRAKAEDEARKAERAARKAGQGDEGEAPAVAANEGDAAFLRDEGEAL